MCYFKFLFMYHLIFGYLGGINRAWLCKGSKVSVLQSNVNLERECWTSSQRLWEAQVLFHWGNTGFFCFHVVNSLMPILALLVISSTLWKPRCSLHHILSLATAINPNRVFHKHTNFAMFALMSTLYTHIFLFFLYLYQMMLAKMWN